MTLTAEIGGALWRARSVATALLLALSAMLAVGPLPALGASCTGVHQVTLDRPTIVPTTGTTATTFTFRLRYRDTANCAPTAVNLRMPGVGTGTFRMQKLEGGTYRGGVSYSVSLTLPAGRWTYWFTAASGRGAGARTVTLKVARPVVVTPEATPSPVSPATSPTPHAIPTRGAPVASRAPGASGDPAPGPGPGGGGDDSGFGFFIPAIFASPAGGVVGPWMALTAIGMSIFWVILRRRPETRRGVLRGLIPALAGGAPAGQPRNPEDGGLPRWLRPSLLAARNAGWGVPPPRAAVRFHEPAAPGADRREIGYRLVRVADGPNDLQSEEIGRFDKGDQVEILETKSPFLRVRGADGLEGWVHQAAVVSILDQLD